jgi:hypothetical protein
LKRFIKFFFILTTLFFSVKTNLNAREISGSLSAGEGSSFIPIQGSAFSIIKDLSNSIYSANYDILIKIGGRVIYREVNQLDDLYLVFNEPVDGDDIIKLDVNSGQFLFKMSQMETLPDVIVDAIKEQAPKEYEQLKPLHNRKKRKPKKPKKPKKKKVIQTPKPKPEPKLEPKPSPKPVEDESRVIKRHMTPDEYKKDIIKQTPPDQVIEESILGKRVSPPTISKPENDLSKFSTSIDNVNKDISKVETSPKREIDSFVTRSDIESVARESRVEAPKISTSSLPVTTTQPLPDMIEQVDSSMGVKSTIPTAQTKIETFTKCTPPTMSSSQTGSFKTEISTSRVEQPNFQKSDELVEIKEIKLDEKVPQFEKEEVVVEQPPVQTYREPEVIVTPPEPVVEEVIEPEVVKREIVKEEQKPKDRIVITKMIAKPKKRVPVEDEPRVIKRHIQPEEYKKLQEIPDRMSDRVLGNGFGMSSSTLKVKAYSNNKPISAWVEVFRADTKKRVKTFYTGKGRSLKDVKLPAGVYVIKATYRTAGSKRKKTIGKITLQEGESINKKITFDDGSIKVKVTKNGKPIYAKVEVYKSGKKRRVAYEFTSRSSGVANLSLGSGEYDIVVRDHTKVRRFNSISISGGKSRTINADF